MNILLIASVYFPVPPPAYGGLEAVVGDLASGLADAGHSVTVVAPLGSRVRGARVLTTVSPLRHRGFNVAEIEKTAMNVVDDLQDYDIINGHNWSAPEYHLRGKVGAKICHTQRSYVPPDYWVRSLGSPRNFIVTSDHMATEFDELGIHSRVAYNGVDLSRYSPPSKDRRSDRLLYVGRFEWFKNALHAIKVAKILGRKIDLVGGSFVSRADYLQEVVAKHDGDSVNVIVDAPQSQKIELMRSACCLLLPSTMEEPSGLVALEAMACGTPVLAYNDGVLRELARGGMVLSRKTPHAMARAFKKAIAISSSDARANACMFSKEVMVKRYELLYSDMLFGREW